MQTRLTRNILSRGIITENLWFTVLRKRDLPEPDGINKYPAQRSTVVPDVRYSTVRTCLLAEWVETIARFAFELHEHGNPTAIVLCHQTRWHVPAFRTLFAVGRDTATGHDGCSVVWFRSRFRVRIDQVGLPSTDGKRRYRKAFPLPYKAYYL